MIINMMGAGSQAKIIDFTLTSDFDIYGDNLVINNVFLPSGTVNGFYIERKGTPATISDFCVFTMFKGYRSPSTQGPFTYYYYRQSDSSYSYADNMNNNAYQYDSSQGTFKIRVSLYGTYLSAGDYSMVIW